MLHVHLSSSERLQEQAYKTVVMLAFEEMHTVNCTQVDKKFVYKNLGMRTNEKK